MKLTIKNIGKIKEAEIDLSKQLTVFFGPNNTGKTYVSYCIYGVKTILPEVDISNALINKLLRIFEKEINRVILGETLIFNLELLLSEVFILLKGKVNSKIYNNHLPSLFGNFEYNYSKCEIKLNHNNDQNLFVSKMMKRNFIVSTAFGDFQFIKNENGEFSLSFAKTQQELDENQRLFLIDFLIKHIITFNIGGVDSFTYFLPAERIGVSVFGQDLNALRLEKANNRINISNYPNAINDFLISQIRLSGEVKPTSIVEYNNLSKSIENDILQGSLRVNETGDVFFTDNSVQNLPLLNSASTIKSLSSLVLYLRYFARKGQTLIIDEPEINLHPENQIKIARILAKISNSGINVITSTHSDYILRELNNLIMLGNLKVENRQKLFEEYEYLNYQESEFLIKDSIAVYHFNNVEKKEQVSNVKITKEGFEIKSIDDEIIKQNNRTINIRWALSKK